MNSTDNKAVKGILKELVRDRYFPVKKTGDKMQLIDKAVAQISELIVKEKLEAQKQVLNTIINSKLANPKGNPYIKGYNFAKAYPKALLQRMEWGATFQEAVDNKLNSLLEQK